LVEADPADNNKLKGISGSIQSVLDSMDGALRDAASDLAKTKFTDQEKIHSVLKELCRVHPYAVDCSVIDMQGSMVAVEPGEYRGVEGRNINRQKQVKKLHRTGKPVMSDMLKVVEGFFAVDLEWPIRSKGGDLIGSVSMIVKPEPFLEKIIRPELTRENYNAWVMQENGQILYSRYKEVIGSYPTADNSYIGNRSLLAALRDTIQNKSGIKRYRQKGIGRSGSDPKALTWTSVGLHGTEWRVILFGKPQY
jgi:hypothetical protein